MRLQLPFVMCANTSSCVLIFEWKIVHIVAVICLTLSTRFFFFKFYFRLCLLFAMFAICHRNVHPFQFLSQNDKKRKKIKKIYLLCFVPETVQFPFEQFKLYCIVFHIADCRQKCKENNEKIGRICNFR